jgi:hypothetical protein
VAEKFGSLAGKGSILVPELVVLSLFPVELVLDTQVAQCP